MKGHLKICKLFVKNIKEENPENNDGKTPSHLAIQKVHVDVFEFFEDLKRNKEGINARDQSDEDSLNQAMFMLINKLM